MKAYSFALAAGLGIMATLASCVKDPSVSSSEDVQKESYASSFVAKYGQINPTQSWDFASGEQRLATRGFSAINTVILEKGVDFGDVSNLDLEHHTFSKTVWNFDIILSGITKNVALHYCPRKSINNSLQRPSALRF